MNKTKIDWADYTWNPVTGCHFCCSYCYALKIAQRFGVKQDNFDDFIYEVTESNIPYPHGFKPTFYWNRLDKPLKIKGHQNIFVCSMADLFGDWIPDEWIERVFNACNKNLRHRYLFLTKNPKRYSELAERMKLPYNSCFFGTTITSPDQTYFSSEYFNTFLSIEPLQENFDKADFYSKLNKHWVSWVIIGSETGNRKGKVIPKFEWIKNIVEVCTDLHIPVFMKESLVDIWGNSLRQDTPWRLEVFNENR